MLSVGNESKGVKKHRHLASTATASQALIAGEPGLWESAGNHLQPTLANGRLTPELSGTAPSQRYCLICPKGEIEHLSEREAYFRVSSVPQSGTRGLGW